MINRAIPVSGQKGTPDTFRRHNTRRLSRIMPVFTQFLFESFRIRVRGITPRENLLLNRRIELLKGLVQVSRLNEKQAEHRVATVVAPSLTPHPLGMSFRHLLEG
jgi:hypothetical protein